MATEYLVLNSVTACLTIHNVTWRHGTKTLISHFAGLSKKLEVICQPPQDESILPSLREQRQFSQWL
jgi:hypothetical protein